MLSEAQKEIQLRKPYLAGYFGQECAPFALKRAKNGEVVVELQQGGAVRDLSSAYNPGQQAARLLESLGPLRGSEILLILGAGNPELLNQVPGLLRENQICITVDAEAALGALLTRPEAGVTQYLLRPGCHLFCGPAMQPALRSYMEALPARRLSGLRVLRHRASIDLDPDFYRQTELAVRDILRSRMSDMLTRFEFEPVWLRNILINTRHLPASPSRHSLGPWQNCLAGTPGLLVAAGPSLRQSLPEIAELRKRAFVLACDTAFRPLAAAGILPHAVLTLDAQRHTLLPFLGSPGLEATLLFADLVTNPLVLRSVRARAVIFSTTARITHASDGSLRREATAGTAFAESIHGPLGALQSGGSVATSGFDLLRNLGCDPILLIGQDLAYTNRTIHSMGTHHTRRWLSTSNRTTALETTIERIVRKRETMDVEGLDGAPVLSDYVLSLYRHWFEVSLPSVSNRVVNLSAAGARIAGAEQLDACAILEELPVLSHDASAAFADALPLEAFEHEAALRLYADVRRSTGEKHAIAQAEALFERHGDLAVLGDRARVYLERNREKLGAQRAETLYARNLSQALSNLERGLRPYYEKKQQ